mgnify:CR=1 FL=1
MVQEIGFGGYAPPQGIIGGEATIDKLSVTNLQRLKVAGRSRSGASSFPDLNSWEFRQGVGVVIRAEENRPAVVSLVAVDGHDKSADRCQL